MSQKDDAVSAAVLAVQAGQVQVLTDQLGSVFDQGEAIGTGPGFTQADIDAAVLAAVGPLNDKIAQDALDLAAAQLDAETKLQAVQVALDAMTAKEQLEESAVLALQGSVQAVQTSLDAIKALVLPVP